MASALAFALPLAGKANAEIVVIVNSKHAAASMTSEQIANIYLGKDASLAPIDLPEASAEREEFYTKVAGKDAAQVKTIWARLIFTGKAKPPKETAGSAAAVKQVASDEKAVAYVERSAVDSSVKVVYTVN
jgi:ABC-type phosphate transport system substrate-binding protein